MGWARLDDKRATNRKLRRAGFAARGLDEAAICLASQEGTDGFISTGDVTMLAAGHGERNPQRLVGLLLEVGRWHTSEDVIGCLDCVVRLGELLKIERDEGWWIHGYLEFNPTAEEWAALRAKKAEAGRKGGRQRAASAQAPALASASPTAKRVSRQKPKPSRPVPSTSSSSSGVPQGGDKPVDDDQNSKLEELWARMAEDDLERLGRERADRRPPEGPRADAWRKTAAGERRRRHGRDAEALLERQPLLTVAQLATELAPAVITSNGVGGAPKPAEKTVAAAWDRAAENASRARAERAQDAAVATPPPADFFKTAKAAAGRTPAPTKQGS